MSWSVNLIGRPAAVADELGRHAAGLSGQSKAEFEAALPHLEALVRQNHADAAAGGYAEPTVHLEASGSGYVKDGKLVQSSCAVSIKPLYTQYLA